MIANEGQSLSSPADLLSYAGRILKKKKPDGELLYSNIHYVVVFAINMKIASPEFPQGIVGWFPGRREKEPDPIRTSFLNDLGESWFKFCAEESGHTYARTRLDLDQIKAMRFIPPTPDQE